MASVIVKPEAVRRRLPLLLALLCLVFQSFGAVVSAWTCEGKVCSADSSACCCSAPPETRDRICRTSVGAREPCAGECGCKLTVESVRAPHVVRAAEKPVLPVVLEWAAILPPSFALPLATILDYAPVRANPPPRPGRPPLLEGAPLRAPPVRSA